MSKKTMRILTLAWAGILIAVLSSTVTLIVAGRTGSSRWVTQAQYDTIGRYARLEEVRSKLVSDYYRELDEDALLLGAVRGMTSSVNDPFTFYYTPEEMQRSNENEQGTYFGIGILINQAEDGSIEVLRVYPDTPAEAAGLQVGDRITAVDGVSITRDMGGSYSEAIAKLRSEDDGTVLLTLHRGQEILNASVVRGTVSISYADWQLMDGDIGYISVTQFTGDAATRFSDALVEFKSMGAKGMVIDLRNNPGGLLKQVVAMADLILPKGTIVYIQDRSGAREDFYSDADCYDIPLVVLVNGNSASASEILAASVQSFGRGTVLGTTTYGKGIVQTLITFPSDGAGMQLTTATYYDGSGRSIHSTGVTPDVVLEFDGDRIPVYPDPAHDNQLAEAIRILRDKAVEQG